MLSENAQRAFYGRDTPTHLRDVIQCLCVLRCDNIRHVMPIWANQVSPLQNWYPIIYIHNDMINSVRYAELGEACLARKKHIITCSGAPRHAVIEPRRMAVVVALAQCEMLDEKQSKNGHDPKAVPVVFIGGVPWRAATRDILLFYNTICLHRTIFDTQA